MLLAQATFLELAWRAPPIIWDPPLTGGPLSTPSPVHSSPHRHQSLTPGRQGFSNAGARRCAMTPLVTSPALRGSPTCGMPGPSPRGHRQPEPATTHTRTHHTRHTRSAAGGRALPSLCALSCTGYDPRARLASPTHNLGPPSHWGSSLIHPFHSSPHRHRSLTPGRQGLVTPGLVVAQQLLL